MANTDKSIRVYRDLARCYDARGQAQVRDRFLVLAADAALSAGRYDDAELLRAELLQANPHHLLRPFATVAQALQSIDVKQYVEGLRRTYPVEQVEQTLDTLRPEGGQEPRVAQAVELPAARVAPPIMEARLAAPERPAEQRHLEQKREESAPSTAAVPPRNMPATEPMRPVQAMPLPAAPLPPADSEPAGNNWVATALFALVLLAAIALAVYTLVRPFL